MTAELIVIKNTQALRVAELAEMASGPGPDIVGPIFDRLIPQVLAVLTRDGITPGMSVGHYEDLGEAGIAVHVGFEIDARAVLVDDRVTVVDLPVVRVASLLHHGSLDTIVASYEQLHRWLRDSGHASTGLSRELYLRWNESPAHRVTELQAVLA